MRNFLKCRCKIQSWGPPFISRTRRIFSFILKITHCANNLKIANCARFCFAAGNRLKNVVFTLRHLANQKGRCKTPVLRRAANSMWKPVNIILKLYSEDAYIFYCFKLANTNRFIRIRPIAYGCGWPFQNVLSAGFIRLLWRYICH
jgi:hypothetical protein